jgi:hypothetical protein
VLSTSGNQDALLSRLRRYRTVGTWAGLVFCCIVVFLHWFWLFLEWQQPAEDVELAVSWPSLKQMLGGAVPEHRVQAQLVQQQQAVLDGGLDDKPDGRKANTARK